MQERQGSSKKKDKNLEGSDYREGLSAVLSILVPEAHLQFEGQTKDKLGSPLARPVVDSIVSDKLTFFLMENGELASNLIRKAIKARDAREAAQKRGMKAEMARRAKKRQRTLSGKLTPAQSKNLRKTNSIWSKETQPAVLPNKDGIGSSKRFFHFVGRFLILKANMSDILKKRGNQHHDLHHWCWSWGRFLSGRC